MSARAWQVGDLVRGAVHFGDHRDPHRYTGTIREIVPAHDSGGYRIPARAFVFDGDTCVGFFSLQDDLATLDDPIRQSLGTVGDEVELLEAAPVPQPVSEPLPALVLLDQAEAHAESRLIKAALAWEASELGTTWDHADAQDELRAAAHDYRKVTNR